MRRPPATSLFNFLLITGMAETTLFQRVDLEGHNLCFFDIYKPPARVWNYMDSLTSSSDNMEIKKCCLHCLQNPNCFAHQVVRSDDGRGFCFTFDKAYYVIFIEEATCKSFVKRDKIWECLIQWNPLNFKTKTNMVGYRVKKMDNSWAIYSNSRGIHLLELNITSCLPTKLSVFDVANANKTEQTRFMNYVDKQAPNGTHMIGYSVGNFYDIGIVNYFNQRFQIALYSLSNSSLAFIWQKGGSLSCRYQSFENGYGYGYLAIITGRKLTQYITLQGNVNKATFLYYNVIW